MEKSIYGSKGKGSDFRRKWDEEAFTKRAQDREQHIKEQDEDEDRRRKGLKPRVSNRRIPDERDSLQARKHTINLNEMIGKVQVVQAASSASKQPGFYCRVCDITVKDSMSYLDHINGKNHQRALNRSMKVVNETVEDVKAKLESLRKKMLQTATPKEYDFHEQVRARQLKETSKREKRKASKHKKAAPKETNQINTNNHEDDEMAAVMGFSGFGTSKH